VANQPGTVSLGSAGNERRVTSVAPGIAGTDAINVNQLSSVVTGLQGQIDANRREARTGIALSMAATSLQYDPRPGKASLAAAVGGFHGQTGLAVGLGYAATDRWRLNAQFSGSPQVNEYGFSAGASWTLN
jgi:autotransporter adhesin